MEGRAWSCDTKEVSIQVHETSGWPPGTTDYRGSTRTRQTWQIRKQTRGSHGAGPELLMWVLCFRLWWNSGLSLPGAGKPLPLSYTPDSLLLNTCLSHVSPPFLMFLYNFALTLFVCVAHTGGQRTTSRRQLLVLSFYSVGPRNWPGCQAGWQSPLPTDPSC